MTSRSLQIRGPALDVSLSDGQITRLGEVSAIIHGFPHDLLRHPTIVQSIIGGTALPARTR
jgi:hypothetical protein